MNGGPTRGSDANTCGTQILHFTEPIFSDSNSTHLGDAPSENNLDETKITNFTGSYLESTLERGLSETDIFRHPPKNLFFT